MTMPPRVRKLILVPHVISSVGWLGAAFVYVLISIYLLMHTDPPTVRIAIPLLIWIFKFAIVPLAAISFLTGVLQGTRTQWGLFRNYWVMFKFLMVCFAIFALFRYSTYLLPLGGQIHSSTPAQLTAMASPGHLVHSLGGVAFLVTATVLGIYKPRGLTPRGWRKQQEHLAQESSALVRQ